MEQILTQILGQLAVVGGQVGVVAVDGRSASGKTTLVRALAERTGAGVIHMDDFFLPQKLRTRERLERSGGNIHFERFQEEVLPRLRAGEDFSYGCFDCRRMAFGERRRVKGGGLYFVEGAYSCHPALGAYMDIRIFSDVAKEIQLERIRKRGGEEALQSFRERWIPMEEAYFRDYHIKEQADMVIDSSTSTCYHNTIKKQSFAKEGKENVGTFLSRS